MLKSLDAVIISIFPDGILLMLYYENTYYIRYIRKLKSEKNVTFVSMRIINQLQKYKVIILKITRDAAFYCLNKMYEKKINNKKNMVHFSFKKYR